ncbi:MAG: hypothetical protein HYY15_05210 [Candidatus Omnitrophica bacterium]|nr:hypothetical protein [Candidatus Omnitrophota bacterium]
MSKLVYRIAMTWGVVGLLGVLFAQPLAAEIPHLVRYQGQAVDQQGVALEGPYALTFRLYDAETNGQVVWQEIQPNIPLSRGHFAVFLGQVTSLASVDWSEPCWLTVQIGTDPELLPRQRIVSVPLAIRAEAAERLTTPITTSMVTGTFAPSVISPQGSGSGLDADTVDGKRVSDLLNRANHTGTQSTSTITGTFPPLSINPQGSGSGLDADLLDGRDATGFASQPHEHQCLTLNLQAGRTGASACQDDGRWCVVAFGENGQHLSCSDKNPFLSSSVFVVCCR